MASFCGFESMEADRIKPVIAIVDENTLSAMGLSSLLEAISNQVQIEIYNSFAQLRSQSQPNRIVHYFVSAKILFEHIEFFSPVATRTILLACGDISFIQAAQYHILNVSCPEKEIVKNILAIYSQGHAHSHQMMNASMDCPLSRREKEILRMVVMGFLNKEIADKYSISLTTVITHRKNITRKLDMKTLTRLTIYSIMIGLVRLEEI